MDQEGNIRIETLLCTVCGMAVAIISDVESKKIIVTCLHAAVGAVVSFFVSLVLNWMIERWRRWPRKVNSPTPHPPSGAWFPLSHRRGKELPRKRWLFIFWDVAFSKEIFDVFEFVVDLEPSIRSVEGDLSFMLYVEKMFWMESACGFI